MLMQPVLTLRQSGRHTANLQGYLPEAKGGLYHSIVTVESAIHVMYLSGVHEMQHQNVPFS